MLQKLMAPLGKLKEPLAKAMAPLGKLTGGNPLIPGIVAFVALAVIVPPLLAGYWIFLVTAGLLTTITAMGLAIIVGWVGEVNLAGAGLLGASVYVTGYFYRVGDSRLNGWPFIPAALTGILFAAFLSGMVAIPTARFSGIYVMVLTLGLQITLERTLFSFPWIIGGFGRNVIVNRPKFLGVSFDSDLRFFYLCLAAAVAAGLFVNALRNSRHGRAMNLIRTDKRAAAAVGISPWRYKILAFAIGGGLIGVAGAFTAPLYRSPPAIVQFIAFQSLFLLAIPVVAGTRTLLGIASVALSFALIPQALESHHLSPFLLGGIGLIAGTIVGPGGLGGNLLDILQKQKEVAILSAVGLAVDVEAEVDLTVAPTPARVETDNGGGPSVAADGDEIVLRDRPPRLKA
ncbi:MAG TPA: branched-chain amino acid ABC transporter permease [Acidimicrobiia bacterium]|jgi:ABC-type branched-subunit amino acid transport system permease subunit